MIQLIHGTDLYLSYEELQKARNDYQQRQYDIKVVDVDNEFDVSDPTALYAILTEQDLFGSSKVIVLKRITSAELFYKLGKALKTSEKLFNAIKTSPHDIILWEDKLLTNKNPLYQLSNNQKVFSAPVKEYEIGMYIQKNFPQLENTIKQIITKDVKSTDTLELSTEIEKLKFSLPEHQTPQHLVLTSNTPTWIISDNMLNYLINPTAETLSRLINSIDAVDQDIRYKLAIIQNHLTDVFAAKRIVKDPKIKDIFFAANRAFVYQKISKVAPKISYDFLFQLYKKSLAVENFLNTGQILEKIALEYIFVANEQELLESLYD